MSPNRFKTSSPQCSSILQFWSYLLHPDQGTWKTGLTVMEIPYAFGTNALCGQCAHRGTTCNIMPSNMPLMSQINTKGEPSIYVPPDKFKNHASQHCQGFYFDASPISLDPHLSYAAQSGFSSHHTYAYSQSYGSYPYFTAYSDKYRSQHHDPRTCFHFYPPTLATFTSLQDRYGRDRMLFRTQESLGFGPMLMRGGDEVWLVGNCPVALVLRKFEGHYTIVGECYLYGALDALCPCPRCGRGVHCASPVETQMIEIW